MVREGWMENFRPAVPWAVSSDTHIEGLEAETFHQVTGLPFCWGCLLKKGTSGHRPVLLLSSLIITLRLGVQQARSTLPGPRSISRGKGNKPPSPFPSWYCWRPPLHQRCNSLMWTHQKIPLAVAPVPFQSTSDSFRKASWACFVPLAALKKEISDTLQLAEGFGKVILLGELKEKSPWE